MNRKLLILLLGIISLGGCAHHYAPEVIEDPYGFFSGLWHGFIFFLSLLGVIVSWILSLFDISLFEDVQIVGVPNTGLGYYIGFFIGILGAAGGGVKR